MTIIYQHFGTPADPRVIDDIDVGSSGELIRPTFSICLEEDSALYSFSSYSIVPLIDAIPVFVLSLNPEAITCPTYVDLVTTGQTDGGSYRLTIEDPEADDPLIFDYIAEAEFPDVVSLTATSNTEMTLVFSKDMEANATLLDPASYVFDKDLSVSAVTVSSTTTIVLTTSAQELVFYNLTASTSIIDAFLNPIDLNTATARGFFTGPVVVPGDAPGSNSYILSASDRNKLSGWEDIRKPEPDQIIPVVSSELIEEVEPTASERLSKTRSLASKVVDKIDELSQKIDKKCSKFKVSSSQGVGSPLFQAMVRVFDEKTTTITYEHYKKALKYRQELAEEDSAKLRLE